MAVLLTSAGVSAARQDEADKGLSLEWLKPSVDDTRLLNSAFFLGYWHRLTDEVMLNVFLPWAVYSPDSEAIKGDWTPGNPHLSVSRATPGAALSYSLGITLPLAPEDQVASIIGSTADLTRIGTFRPNALTLDAAVHWQSRGGRRFSPFAGVGTAVVEPTGVEGGQREVFLTFYGGHWQPVGFVNLAAGINGHYGAVRGGTATGDVLVIQMLLGLRFHYDTCLPWLTLRLPLSRHYREATRSIVGVGIAIPMP